ncbi:hypothetical protein ES703_00076 [subsurface metagenome]
MEIKPNELAFAAGYLTGAAAEENKNGHPASGRILETVARYLTALADQMVAK